MPLFRAQVELDRDTALPEDKVVNTFHFSSALAVEDAAISIASRLNEFYNTAPSTLQSVASYLSSLLSGTGRLKVYLLDDPLPRIPRYDEPFTLAAIGANSLPEEVAACLSFKAAALSGTVPARRRGRVYIGPLSQSAVNVVTGRVRMYSGLMNTLGQAARTSLLGAGLFPGTEFHVFSPTANTSAPVTEFWVDDALDTQRRRGPDATARIKWDVDGEIA